MTNKTALIAVDLQNHYIDPNGRLYSESIGAHLPAILQGIETLRAQGVYIVFARQEATGKEHSFDTEVLRRRDPIPEAGTWEAELDSRVNVHADDLVFRHYASSALFGGKLAELLKARGIQNVICCGVKTNYNVRATATDAMWYGFKALVASDMVACDSDELNNRHLEELTKYTAKSLSLAEILTRIEDGKL